MGDQLGNVFGKVSDMKSALEELEANIHIAPTCFSLAAVTRLSSSGTSPVTTKTMDTLNGVYTVTPTLFLTAYIPSL